MTDTFRFFIFFFLLPLLLPAQQQIITFGLQYKPLIPNKFFRSGDIKFGQDVINYSIEPKMSFSGGMVIRKGFTKIFSMESGINFVKRNYDLKVENNTLLFAAKQKFSIVGYEAPTLALVFIRLGEKIFMDAAFGASVDFFPSDVGTHEYYVEKDVLIESITIRNNNRWIQASLLANLGYEFRTLKSGYFYFGSSLHRPFAYNYLTNVKYMQSSVSEKVSVEITGNYLTFDFRYFFHQEPQKPKVKEQDGKTIQYFENLKKSGNKM